MPETLEILTRIDTLKAELDALRPLDRELEERVLQKFRLWWTYHSNAIEGNKLTQGETEMFLMEGLTAKGKPLKDHLDLRGHSNAINYLLAFIRNKEVLTEAVIRKLHEVLLVEPYRVQAITPDGLPTTKTVSLGKYKTEPNHVRTATGEIHYYTSPDETPAKMYDLLTWQRENLESGVVHPVEVAAKFHHRFTEIHPFDDGNGRMVRLLMNLMLMQRGYPPVVIQINAKDEYLSVLRKADLGDFQDFAHFIATRVATSLDLFLRAARGEDIQEPTDLEKEITLLKMELRHVEEPVPLTPAAQKSLFERSLDPLFMEIGKALAPLCELFSGNQVVFDKTTRTGNRRVTNGQSCGIAMLSRAPRPERNWEDSEIIEEISSTFSLNGFKKNRFDAFDLVAALQLKFETLKYVLELRMAKPALVLQHFYQEQLSRDEIADVAQAVARFFVAEIKKKAGIHVDGA